MTTAKIKIVILTLVLTFFPQFNCQNVPISCNYVLENSENYACNLQINNPDGRDDFESISGEHLDGFSDSDVTIVRATNQLTTIVPSIICRQFTNVTSLIVASCQVHEITTQSFEHCSQLEVINLYLNRIVVVSANSFVNNINLRSVDLTDNYIEGLSVDTFNGSSIESLTLDYNEISDLGVNFFASISETLRTLSLHSNLLREIPADAFAGLNLENLQLSANYLQDIPFNAFATLENLQILSLFGNQLTTLRSEWFTTLGALENLRLEFNQISELPVGIFSANNRLSDLGLTFNLLSVIDSRSFGDLGSFRTLYAEFNFINAIDEGFFDRALNLSGLFLYNNVCTQSSFYDVASDRASVRSALSPCFDNFVSDSTLECFYLSAEFFPYTCELTVINPSGRDDFESIAGEHVEPNGDTDVLRIDAYAQNTLNFPSILCDRFVNLQEIVIGRSQIEVLTPRTFENCVELTFLDLEHNRVTALPDGIFSNNPKLEVLVLNDNRLNVLSSATFAGTQIWYLDLQRNSLFYFNADWFTPINSTLLSLNLVGNGMSYLPVATFTNLRNLEELEIGLNPFMFIPNDAFAGLSRLEYLAMFQNDISQLQSSWFEDLTSLQGLHIQQNSIDSLPAGIFSHMMALVDINLSQNNLSTLHANAFGNVASLASLNAQFNQIDAFDPDLFEATDVLYILFLYGNTCVSANFINVAGTREGVRGALANCFDNFIRQERGIVQCEYVDADGFGYFCEMTVNNPRGNDEFERIDGIHIEGFTDTDVFRVEAFSQSTTIVPSIICRQFINLRELYIGASNVVDISPSNFENCVNLEYLNLELNNIREIPSDLLANSPNLGYLSFYFNEISSINENAFVGTAIWNLKLDGNQLSDLNPSPWLSSINNTLTHLSLTESELTDLPENSFENLRNLRDLDLGYNPLLSLPSSVFNGAENLEFLYLTRCNLRELNSAWFENLENLQGLLINYNQLRSLPSRIFANNNRLFELNIAGNELRLLNSDIFGNVSSLLYLTAGNNRLQGIDAEIFDAASSLYNLFLFNNVCVDENFVSVARNRSEIRRQLENCFDTFARDGTLECSYLSDEFFPYRCELSVQNIGGRDDFIDIGGQHVGNNGDADVQRLEAFGQVTTNFPSIFCTQFVNLREIFVAASEIEWISTRTFENCVNMEYLNMELNALTTLGNGVFTNCVNLNSLSFYGNQLSVIEALAFDRLSLTYLNLDVNQLSYINPSWWLENSQLNYLALSSNQLVSLPSRGFSSLNGLRDLFLSNNPMEVIPVDAFEGLSGLQILNLNNCSLTELRHAWFNDLINLQRIYLNSNRLSALPSSIFTNLTHVNVQSNSLRVINANSFDNIESLIQLSAQNNEIFGIDVNFFDSATALYTLQLLNNDCASQNFLNIPVFRDDVRAQLSTCFENFASENFEISCEFENGFLYTCFLTLNNPLARDDFEAIDGDHLSSHSDDDVVSLEAENQQSSVIPQVICRQFRNLSYIYMINSQVEVFTAATLAECTQLVSLTLDSNRIVELGENFFLNTPHLALLSMAANRITRVSRNAFANLTNLILLDLELNEIDTIDGDFLQSAAESLYYLILSGNRLTNIPAGTFRNLRQLTFLDLSSNDGLTLPEPAPFGDLASLMTLAMDNSNITSLTSDTFSGLTGLFELSMRSNLVATLPENVFNSLTSLQYLVIDNLLLEELQSSSFGAALNTLRVIRARNNRIRLIDETIVDNLVEFYLLNNICIDINFTNVQNNIDEVRSEMSRCFA